jgi:hypothetical protein
MEYVTSFPGYLVHYVQGFGTQQLIVAVVVALFFGIAAARIIGAILLPVISAIVFLAVLAVTPTVLSHAPIAVPAFDADLLKKAVALYIVFLVTSGIVFGIKKAILGLFDR